MIRLKPSLFMIGLFLDQHSVLFDTTDIGKAMRQADRSQMTKFVGWLVLNATEKEHPLTKAQRGFDGQGNLHPASKDLRFKDLPKYYVWRKTQREWGRRTPGTITHPPQRIGRIFPVPIKDTKRWYLRYLINYKRGPTSWNGRHLYVYCMYSTCAHVQMCVPACGEHH